MYEEQKQEQDQAHQKVIDVLKEGPHKYYKVIVRRVTTRETEYLVKHKVSDGEFDAYDHTPDLSMGDCPENWTNIHDDLCAEESDPEIELQVETDENGNELNGQ